MLARACFGIGVGHNDIVEWKRRVLARAPGVLKLTIMI